MAEVALQADGVAVCRGAQRIVREVSFASRFGSVLAIVGTNGAGKTTLLKALAGLLPTSAGQIWVEGANLRRYGPRERAQRIGYVPQRAGLSLSVSVQDVVAQGRYVRRAGLRSARGDEAVREALGRTGLLGMHARAFHTLSGGEQRRVLLARALATGARVLLLDEPTAGLDVAHVLRFFGLVRELKTAGYAVIGVLHDLSDVRAHADEALVLRGGTIHSLGPVADVIAERAAREAYGVALRENAALGYRLLGERA